MTRQRRSEQLSILAHDGAKDFYDDIADAADYWPDGDTVREDVSRAVIAPDTYDIAPGNDEAAIVETVEAYCDDNGVHLVPGLGKYMAEHITDDADEPVLPPIAFSESGLVMQGAKEFADAVRDAPFPVAGGTAEYNLPVDSDGAYQVERADGGESVTVYRPDLPDAMTEQAGPAAEIALTPREDVPEDMDAAAVNDIVADKILDSLSHAPFEGHILLETTVEDAGVGDGVQQVGVTARQVKDGGDLPYDIYSSSFAYEDGTTVNHVTMGFDPDAYESMLDDFARERGGPVTPVGAAAHAWGTAMAAGAAMSAEVGIQTMNNLQQAYEARNAFLRETMAAFTPETDGQLAD